MRTIIANRIESGFWLTLLVTIYFLSTDHIIIGGFLFVLALIQFKSTYILSKFNDKTKIRVFQALLSITYHLIPKQYVILNLQVIVVSRLWNRGEDAQFICKTAEGYVLSHINKEKTASTLKKAVILLSDSYRMELDKLR